MFGIFISINDGYQLQLSRTGKMWPKLMIIEEKKKGKTYLG